ncbi:hypothetical protein [Roseovarius faecimaris]|uniref:hypothetical protein n=1 Tax=Roseovarius faecimaris TaxID=2494550 RepID=UPI0012FE0D73|nr:hypothetical protein [Roseovarius faecimaris]
MGGLAEAAEADETAPPAPGPKTSHVAALWRLLKPLQFKKPELRPYSSAAKL